MEYFVAQNNNKNKLGCKQDWLKYCPDWSPLCGIKKPKYIEGYSFNEDSDDNATDSTPLMSREPTQQNAANTHIHIITGYLSVFEALILLMYTGSLIGFTVYSQNPNSSLVFVNDDNHKTSIKHERLLAIFCIFHSLLWVMVAGMDRIVQWRHRVMRRKGYLKFYRRMRNIRRVPFVMISTGTAALLIFLSALYYCHLTKRHDNDDITVYKTFTAFHAMYIIVGIEVIISVPCLLYYIFQATKFNCQNPAPDVIQETTSVSNSPTATLTSVGFRDGEDLDELLERQADMIRYLQQHNASLGRRIMELQSRTLE